jgi:branched-subunit amino acid transport protein AzlD
MDEIYYPKELRRALAGEYSFTTGEILSEGYQASDGFKGTVWIAIGIITAISIVIGIFTELLGGSQLVEFLADTIGALIIQPMNAGLMMLGVLYTGGKAVRPQQVLDYYERALKIVLLQLLIIICFLLGCLLFILPGLYFLVGVSLAKAIMLKYDLGIRESMRISIRIVHHHWFSFLGLYVVMGLTVIVSAIPLGIGLIWTIPMAVCVYGKLFNTVVREGINESPYLRD